jgi:hypothetical protein
MKKKLLSIFIIITTLCLEAANLNSYRDTPLLNSRVQENDLPWGEYVIIRSYRNTTQLLISNDTKIYLFTDRDNMKDSEIFISAYSRFEDIILDRATLTQQEFNIIIERVIRYGYNSISTTIPFPGCERFMEEINNGAEPKKNDGDYLIYIKDENKSTALMTINTFWKKLTLRNLLKSEKFPTGFYSVYIDECYDKNIKKIIREYSGKIKKIEK